MSASASRAGERILQPAHHLPKGVEATTWSRPTSVDPDYTGSGRLDGKVALITGGGSGIGRAVAILFAKEGADVAILYLDEHADAAETRSRVEAEGRACLCLAGDVGDESFCREAVSETVRQLDRLDIVVNNATEQHAADSLEDISAEQLERTFRTNFFSCFYVTKAALHHLGKGSSIINTTAVTASPGSDQLVDCAVTKGAIVSFTRSLSVSLVARGIRVNGVAPGPVWTPLSPASPSSNDEETFGSKTPTERPAQATEIAPSYLFLASNDSSFMTGQILQPNGGEIIG